MKTLLHPAIPACRRHGVGNRQASRQRKILKILIISLLTVSFIFPLTKSLSQVAANELFVKTYNGPANGPDGGKDVAVDSAGNATVAASSRGVGTGMDFYLVKYSPEGDTLWTRRYNGSGNGNDLVRDMEMDEAGNIYVTGVSMNTNGNYDALTLKYGSDGTLLATMVYDGGANDEGREVGAEAAMPIIINDTAFANQKSAGKDVYFINLHPNPAKDRLTIEYNLPKPVTNGIITFYDLVGRINEYAIKEQKGKRVIDITNWSDGLYYYTIIVNNNTIARDKIVILK